MENPPHKKPKSHLISNTFFIVVALLIVLFVYVTRFHDFSGFPKPITASTNVSPHKKPPLSNVYLGFWTQNFWDSQTHSVNPQSLDKLQNEIGKKVAIANYYQGWQYLANPQIVNDLDTINANGWRPMLSTNPYIFSLCPANGLTLYKAIANGNCDAFLHLIGKNLKKVKKPFFLRFAWEMNVDSMEWSTSHSGSHPQDFVKAWRRFHDIVVEEGATNVVWVFSPQVETRTTIDIAKLYPGDKYTSWVGLDGYNWGTAKSWSTWQDFHSLYYNSYVKMGKIAPDKPLMIAEVNTTNIGGDQAAWYKSMLSQEVPNDFPNIKAIIFFNEDKTSTEGVKWLIDNSPQSLQQFKSSISNPMYKSTF
ncbi:MAG: glycoside hydrolase family 26 protein [Candidatus Levyibacteriota bacterium]